VRQDQRRAVRVVEEDVMTELDDDARVVHRSVEERRAIGKQARVDLPLDAHAEIGAVPGRDVVGLLTEQAADRLPELVPIRHGRMSSSTFAFLRGAALPMAVDLASSPTSTLTTQLCGDAHLSNFGFFASPERHLVFDLNDFDETYPGPFEWDVKRLAASVEVAARGNGMKRSERRAAVVGAVASYRYTMRRLAKERNLAVWYDRVEYDDILPWAQDKLGSKAFERLRRGASYAVTRDSLHDLKKLTRDDGDGPRFVSRPPLLVAINDLAQDADPEQVLGWLHVLQRRYRSSLQSDRRRLLEQFTLVDAARKVVGVGSVGTRAWVMLLLGRDESDPLFLQVKEAQESVLARVLGSGPRFRHQGERVVSGQRLMQSASDIFLGSLRAVARDGVERDFYVRQLRDWKMSASPELMEPRTMTVYAQVCGRVLARAHARGGDRVAIAAYLGSSETFDHAVADFATAYADVTERDHAALVDAIGAGRVVAERGL
jgi:uncharacterized protein (DUF2252 family)